MALATAPILNQNGQAEYQLSVPDPGSYQLRATVTYSGIDGQARTYDLVGPSRSLRSYSIDVELPGPFSGATVEWPTLYLSSQDAVCGR